jgi:dCTP deaminase
LGVTHEWVELPLAAGIAARVEGRSTLARMGLVVHLTAPIIHAGWEGKITLEMVNLGGWPIKLRPRELRICQLVFERVGELSDSETDSDSSPQFQGQRSPAG